MRDTFFAENLTYLIKKKGLSNAYVSGVLGRGRQLITDYKNGAKPSFEILLKLAEILDLSLDDLVYTNLTEHDIEVDGQIITLEHQKNYLIPARAQAGTTLEWSQEAMNRFERVHIPGVYGEARTWEVQGDSMEPLIFDGDYVTGKRASMSEFIPGGVCVVITRTQGIHIKKVEWNDSGGILLTPVNPKHQPYVLPLDEIREIWYTQLKITKLVMRPTFLDSGKQPVFPVVRVERDKDQK